MDRLRSGLEGCHVLRFKNAHYLLHCDLPRARRAHAADPIGAVIAAYGITLLDLVAFQILQGHVAWIRSVTGHRRHDVLRDLPGVEGVGSLVGDGAQGLGQGRIPENCPDRLRLAVGLVEIGTRHRIVLEILLLA